MVVIYLHELLHIKITRKYKVIKLKLTENYTYGYIDFVKNRQRIFI